MYRLWIEWDFGQEDCVFSSQSLALDWFKKNVSLTELSGEFATHQEIFDAGLASIQELRLDP